MSQSSISVFVFGIYLSLTGFILLAVPNLLLTTFGMAPTSEVWIRLSGILLMALSVYYIVAAKQNIIVILKITAYIRATIIFFFVAFVMLNMVSRNIILFGIIDFLGAAWTYTALRKEGHL
jgi:hypothetical protein